MTGRSHTTYGDGSRLIRPVTARARRSFGRWASRKRANAQLGEMLRRGASVGYERLVGPAREAGATQQGLRGTTRKAPGVGQCPGSAPALAGFQLTFIGRFWVILYTCSETSTIPVDCFALAVTARAQHSCSWRINKSKQNQVFCGAWYHARMRDVVILFVHLIVTVVRLTRPGGLRSVVAESVLVKHQLQILNRGRKRAPNLRATDRIIVGLCALFMRRARLLRSAIVLKPSTLLHFHDVLKKRKYRMLFSAKLRRRPGPTGPNKGNSSLPLLK